VHHIELREIAYEYAADAGPVLALENVAFGVAESELLCVVGRSGCGKTTLLNIVAGFLAPTKGEVRIGGRAVSGRGLDRGIVFQDFAQLFPWRTAQRNVEFGLEMRGVGAAERAATARRFLRLVDLERFAVAQFEDSVNVPLRNEKRMSLVYWELVEDSEETGVFGEDRAAVIG